MTLRHLLALLLFCFWGGSSGAQAFNLSGAVIDSIDGTPAIGASVKIFLSADTAKAQYTTTDISGNYILEDLSAGIYSLRITYLGYQNVLKTGILLAKNLVLTTIELASAARTLDEVNIVGIVPQSAQRGDTTQFNASAFKTNPDATTDDLVKKLPGITVLNGQIQAEGEAVQRVLVDGKPFFGDDPSLALKNLPAEVVDKIEVFDRLSDQAQFSGFDDGNAQKTINIVTKPEKNTGRFGRVFAGYGSGNRFSAGGSINFFGRGQRVTLIGLGNNINQQNFSSQDLIGTMSGGGGRRDGGNANNFLTGQQNGITGTSALGFNYNGSFGEKLEVNGSYFFNRASNNNYQVTSRETFLPNGNQIYRDTSSSSNTNLNHRASMRVEYSLNHNNSIIFTPSASWQQNESVSLTRGLTNLFDGSLLNSTSNQRFNQNAAFNLNSELLWRHRFNKDGRTLTVELGGEFNNNDGDSWLTARNAFIDQGPTASDTIDQRSEKIARTRSYDADIEYTDPIGKNSQIEIEYEASVRNNDSRNETNHLLDGAYSVLDTLLSNTFENQYLTQSAGLSYRYRTEGGWDISAGINAQSAGLFSEQHFPRTNEVNTSFFNWLPNVRFRFRSKDGKGFRLFYRTGTQEPSIWQLQNVIDNSNPLFLTAGNPSLRQEYTHRFMARYNTSNSEKGNTFFAMIGANLIQGNITNVTFIADVPMTLPNGIRLEQGAQLSSPVNVDGNRNLRSYVSYGFPIKPLKVNLNLSAGGEFQRTPGLINEVQNISNNFTLTQGTAFTSNISEKVDFSLSFNGNYNIVRNTIQPRLNNNFFSQSTSASVIWLFWKGFMLQSDVTYLSYRGLGEGFNRDFTLWNASFGKKFLKDNKGELKVTAFDILRQNNSISRSVTQSYQQDVNSLVLTQYFMITFSYTLRNFGHVRQPQNQPDFDRRDHGQPNQFPGGGPPNGGFNRGEGRP